MMIMKKFEDLERLMQSFIPCNATAATAKVSKPCWHARQLGASRLSSRCAVSAAAAVAEAAGLQPAGRGGVIVRSSPSKGYLLDNTLIICFCGEVNTWSLHTPIHKSAWNTKLQYKIMAIITQARDRWPPELRRVTSLN